MTRLLAIVPFTLLAAVLPPAGGSHLSATQAPAGPVSTMPADADPSFEVATIKPSPGGVEGPRYSLRGRILVAVAASLHDLIKFAYGVHASQVVGAPAWVASDRYDVEAVPRGEGMPNDRQFKTMLQKLLAERFQLAFHRDQRELPAFVVVLGSGPPKLTPTKAPGSLPVAGVGPGLFYGVNATTTDFTTALQGAAMDRPVVDQTGLTGRWDFRLEWTPDPSQFGGRALTVGPSDANRPPALSTAIQEQLGLKLESKRTLVDMAKEAGGKPATTLTLYAGFWPRAFIVHVGDSRMYRYRDGELTRFTSDQTYEQLMLESGLSVGVGGQHNGTALHWAAFHGNADMIGEILKFNPDLETKNNDFNSTPLGWAIHGSEHGWYARTGDYPQAVELLLQAGAKRPAAIAGTAAVRAVLERR